MGTFFHPITIVGPNGEETVEALVDTEHLFALIPADVVERLGVKLLGERTTREGRRITQTEARLGAESGWVMSEIGEPGEEPRIGRHTLDSFLLDIDPEGNLVPKELHEVRHF